MYTLHRWFKATQRGPPRPPVPSSFRSFFDTGSTSSGGLALHVFLITCVFPCASVTRLLLEPDGRQKPSFWITKAASADTHILQLQPNAHRSRSPACYESYSRPHSSRQLQCDVTCPLHVWENNTNDYRKLGPKTYSMSVYYFAGQQWGVFISLHSVVNTTNTVIIDGKRYRGKHRL